MHLRIPRFDGISPNRTCTLNSLSNLQIEYHQNIKSYKIQIDLVIFLIFHLTSMVQQKKPSICHERAGFNQPCLGYVLIFKSRVEAAKDSSKDCCVPRITLNSQRTKPTQKLKHANKQMQPLKHFFGGVRCSVQLVWPFFWFEGFKYFTVWLF